MSQVKLQGSFGQSGGKGAGHSIGGGSKKARSSRKAQYASGHFASRATSGLSSRKSGDEKNAWSKYPRLPDSQGGEATPKPLLDDEKKVSYDGKDTQSELASQSQSSHQPLQQLMPEKSSIGLGSRSIQSSSVMSIGSDYDDYGERGSIDQLQWTELKTLRDPMDEQLTDADLEADVDLEITETDTVWIFDMPPRVVNAETDGDIAEVVKQRNEAYKALLADKVGNDKYIERDMNTLEATRMTRPSQTEPIELKEFGNTASAWDMHDSFLALAEAEKEQRFDQKNDDDEVKDADEEQVMEDKISLEPAKSTLSGAASASPSGFESELGTARGSSAMTSEDQAVLEAVLQTPAFKETLFIIERAVVQNISQGLLADYRHLPILQALSSEDEDPRTVMRQKSGLSAAPQLNPLWTYSCSVLKGQAVTCMKWNHQNKDILAASYGRHDYEPEMRHGIVCCWSVKNIAQPERLYHTNSGVTAIAWSSQYSFLLAVGLFDGHILIFDVRSNKEETVFDSYESSGRHYGPVRSLEWVRKEAGKHEDTQEVLVSVASDGRVMQWSIRKGFEFKELMRLKRVTTQLPGPSRKQKEQKADALISRHAIGSALAFNPNDKNIYMIGTEDGNVHKCSCSYNEQYLENYSGHSGPVHAIRWSPFVSDVFLTCSADWTVSLWQVDRATPVTAINSTNDSVNCISWSPKSSCVFASVNDRQLQVWNMTQSTLDPVILEPADAEGGNFTQVVFSENSDSLLVGDSEGIIHVMKLQNLPAVPKNQSEALDRVIQLALKTELASESSHA